MVFTLWDGIIGVLQSWYVLVLLKKIAKNCGRAASIGILPDYWWILVMYRTLERCMKVGAPILQEDVWTIRDPHFTLSNLKNPSFSQVKWGHDSLVSNCMNIVQAQFNEDAWGFGECNQENQAYWPSSPHGLERIPPNPTIPIFLFKLQYIAVNLPQRSLAPRKDDIALCLKSESREEYNACNWARPCPVDLVFTKHRWDCFKSGVYNTHFWPMFIDVYAW